MRSGFTHIYAERYVKCFTVIVLIPCSETLVTSRNVSLRIREDLDLRRSNALRCDPVKVSGVGFDPHSRQSEGLYQVFHVDSCALIRTRVTFVHAAHTLILACVKDPMSTCRQEFNPFAASLPSTLFSLCLTAQHSKCQFEPKTTLKIQTFALQTCYIHSPFIFESV